MGSMTEYDVLSVSFIFASSTSTMASLCSNYWYVSKVHTTLHSGLWRTCSPVKTFHPTVTECRFVDSSSLNIFPRILIILTCLILLTSSILKIVNVSGKRIKIASIIPKILLVAALAMIVAMLLATFNRPLNMTNYGWSYLLGWVSVVLISIITVLDKMLHIREVSNAEM
ncbi:protein NKG7-like [Hydractinia symbiolongicarpus]|uniref:protein NKG7-like n=1 Tax=Hydractinia symbiolongicarpus TaxID=13093 RepID=UPI002549EC29|nr:protein NKG7-like [Hydractinia symbiolongicarpus]